MIEGSSQTTVGFYDFETGIQGWTPDTNSGLNNNEIWSCSQTQSVYVKDDTNTSIITSPTLNLSRYASANFSFCLKTESIDNNEGFDLEYYNGFSWSVLKQYRRGVDFVNTGSRDSYNFSFTMDASYIFTFNSRFRFVGKARRGGGGRGNRNNSAYNYFDNILIEGFNPSPEINITGNGISILNGDSTPSIKDNTNFSTTNVGATLTKTFTIQNLGSINLNVSNITFSNTTDFSLTGTPYASPISAGNSTTFTILVNSSNIGTKSSVVTINNNDSDEGTYTFSIEANIEQNFFDSDGDGVFDNVDIDDDNDGIEDAIEELACQNTSVSTTTNYKFLNETFGGGSRATINTTYDATTTYCYEDGTNGVNTPECSGLSSRDLGDGEYTVYHKAGNGDGIDQTPNNEIASYADAYWYTGEDHTEGDTNGRMAMFNASYEPGVFYTATIKGSLPNIPITYSFWVLNLDTTNAPGINTRLRPNILVEFRDASDNLLTSITTGDIPPSINGDAANSWHQFTANLTFNVSEFYVYFINNETGGLGNDLAIDDITISQTLCDTDNDGVANIFDLDCDNDGIPDVVEAGLGNYSGGIATLTNSSNWVDANGNGMSDIAEGNVVLDSDNDGIPNYLDLDSDNDSVFDVDESGAGNTSNPTYQNGDGDITGDGVGDGLDTDKVRQTDIDSDGIIEYFSDGILDLYDFYNGENFDDAYGNSNQGSTGTGWYHYVKDTDNDGIPDYIDVMSNGSTFDISQTLYFELDKNNDGVIDDTLDNEGDGILDLFDTNDNIFGSPRDLDQKLQLYFDGRNDYVEDTQILNELQHITLMGWIKIDSSFVGRAMVFGQSNFEIEIQDYYEPRIYARVNNTSVSNNPNSNPLVKNQWYHIAAVYNGLNNTLSLYINGEKVATTSEVGSSLNPNSYGFTIGRSANFYDTDTYFKGFIDEVRVFNKSLSSDEIHKMVYQEVENNFGVIKGSIIPKNINNFDAILETSTPLNWTSLIRYFRMDTYKDDILDNLTTPNIDEGFGAKIYNTKILKEQTAPLPFVTQQSGDLSTAITNLEKGINGNDVANYDWSIIKIKHNISINKTHKNVALIVDQQDATSNPITLKVLNDSELNVSWYLKLDGKLDLEGDSQLIQGKDSTLDEVSIGTLEKDQQGTADTFTYNYWSSPVGISNNTTNNNSYNLKNIFTNIDFKTSGYNGSASPLQIADYWIFKFANKLSDNYSDWQQVRSTGTLKAGEGFTMKGPGTGSITTDQNYVLEGKPNNGDIKLDINSGNDYLIGNPYPSAIDAEQFIRDNGPTIAGTDVGATINGTLYFWEHWGGGSHNLNEYQGGYATYTLSGGVPSASKGTNDPDVGTGGTPTKTPGRYIPVGQGFFVTAETTGTIEFNNGQRIFQKEDGTNSLFVKASNTKNKTASTNKTQDKRMKIRLGFNSVNEIHRQLLVTVDAHATSGKDWGYDARYNETQIDDMYWMLEDEKYVIQGVNEINENTILPLGLHSKTDGLNIITIDKLENVSDNLEIYLYDLKLNNYHNLRESDYQVTLLKGEYLNRFQMVFSNQKTLSNDEVVENIQDLDIYFNNETQSLNINNPKLKEISSVNMYNILAQSVYINNKTFNKNKWVNKVNGLSSGIYVVKLKSEDGEISKKILVN